MTRLHILSHAGIKLRLCEFHNLIIAFVEQGHKIDFCSTVLSTFAVIAFQIVSIEEVRRRKDLLDIEKYIPLPELREPSNILQDIHIKQVNYQTASL